MLELNLYGSHSHRPNFSFPRVGSYSHTHSLWVSNLLVELTYVGPNPILHSYGSYISAAKADYHAVIANTLLMWYMFLGGQVEGDTLWVVDKSYVQYCYPLFSANSKFDMSVIH